MDRSLLLTILGYLLLLVGLLAALKGRWLSRFERGFQWSLLLSFAVLGIGATVVLGVWGHVFAKGLLNQQIVGELENVGKIVDREMGRETQLALAQMHSLSKALAEAYRRGVVPEMLDRMQELQETDPQLLQLRLTDASGRVVAERSVTGQLDPINHLAAGASLEGRAFASDPFLAAAFGRYVLNLSVPVRDGEGRVIGTLGARYDIESSLQNLTRSARFGTSGYAVVVNHDGHIIAHPDSKRRNDDISSYSAVQEARAGGTGSLVVRNKAGLERLMFYRPLQSSATLDPKPLVLLTEINHDEVTAILHRLRNGFLLATLLVVAASLVVTHLLTKNIQTPLLELMDVAGRIRKGDLSHQASMGGRDEVGHLSQAVNAMVEGLRERERVIQVFGQYVATQVSEKVLKGEVNLGGESRTVTILFSDIRDFTTLSEQMPPLQVVGLLNDYFSEMVDAIFEHSGILDKFMGDGLMAVFGAFGDAPDHAAQAVRTALRMKSLLAKINGERESVGQPPLAIGIGIHTAEVVLGNIGSRKRLQYTAVGDGVNTCARLEGLNKDYGTTILISDATRERLQDEFECRPLPEASLKGKSERVKVFEVLNRRSG